MVGGGGFRFNLIACRPQSEACARVQNDDWFGCPRSGHRRGEPTTVIGLERRELVRLQFSPHKPHVCFTARNLRSSFEVLFTQCLVPSAKIGRVRLSVREKNAIRIPRNWFSRAAPSRMVCPGRTCVPKFIRVLPSDAQIDYDVSPQNVHDYVYTHCTNCVFRLNFAVTRRFGEWSLNVAARLYLQGNRFGNTSVPIGHMAYDLCWNAPLETARTKLDRSPTSNNNLSTGSPNDVCRFPRKTPSFYG